LTDDKVYEEWAGKLLDFVIKSIRNENSLYSETFYYLEDGQIQTVDTASLYTESRQFYKSLILSHIQSNYANTEALELYIDAIEAMMKYGVFSTYHNPLTNATTYYATDYYYDTLPLDLRNETVMEYSTCYLGAMLSLGAVALEKAALRLSNSVNNSKADEYQQLAKKHRLWAIELTETCHQASALTATKLGPYAFYPEKGLQAETKPKFALR